MQVLPFRTGDSGAACHEGHGLSFRLMDMDNACSRRLGRIHWNGLSLTLRHQCFNAVDVMPPTFDGTSLTGNAGLCFGTDS
jgi:hypothetical protein